MLTKDIMEVFKTKFEELAAVYIAAERNKICVAAGY